MNPSNPNNPQPQQPQPVQPPSQMAAPQLAQAPAPDTNSFQEQPKVQYVVMQKSLEGLGGWVAFFMVIFALSAIGYFSSTFNGPVGLHTFTNPLLAIGYLSTVVLIALRKRLALWVIYATLALSFVVGVINTLVGNDVSQEESIGGVIVGSLIFHGLVALYFYVSKRVKATLVK